MMTRFVERMLLEGARLLSRPQPRWEGAAPSGAQRIYCANHTSHLDFAVVATALPPHLRTVTRPVAGAEYWTADPVRRFVARDVFRAVLIERERRSLNPLEPVLEALRRGDSLIFFPEGTRGPGGELQPLKPGICHIARQHPAIELVPVWIRLSWRCTVNFGPPLRWNPEADDADFLARLRMAMEAARSC